MGMSTLSIFARFFENRVSHLTVNITDTDGADVVGKGSLGPSKDPPGDPRHNVQKADVPSGIDTYLGWDSEVDPVLDREKLKVSESNTDSDHQHPDSGAPSGGFSGHEAINSKKSDESSWDLHTLYGSVDPNDIETASVHERHMKNDDCFWELETNRGSVDFPDVPPAISKKYHPTHPRTRNGKFDSGTSRHEKNLRA